MSNNDTSKPASTGGDTNDELVSKEFFLSLTPASFEALPPKRQQAVIRWLLNNPHHLERYSQTPTKKETTK